MSFYMVPFVQRITLWKELRDQMKTIEDMYSAIELSVNFWSKVPITVNEVIDWNSPRLWPTPWELIHDNDYCNGCRSFLIHQTLKESNETLWKDVEFRYYPIFQEKYVGLILSINDEFIVNYEIDQILFKDQVDIDLDEIRSSSYTL